MAQQITLVGTIRKHRTELPVAFTTTKGRQIFTSVYGFQRDATSVSYCPEKNKVVAVLSTMHSDKGRDPTTKNKSDITEYYNSTKEGVDTMDQMTRCYSTKGMARRWSMVIFFNKFLC